MSNIGSVPKETDEISETIIINTAGMEENCIGCQSPQRTVALEKKKIIIIIIISTTIIMIVMYKVIPHNASSLIPDHWIESQP
jgi:hypothetical protein